MGSSTVLVIGDDWRDQLDRYQLMDYAHPQSRHIVPVDRLPEALQRYPNATTARFRLPDGREVSDFTDELKPGGGPVSITIVHEPLNASVPFAEWARSEYGVDVLDSGEAPDLAGKHRGGWMRLNESGKVMELVTRTIPRGFILFFIGTYQGLLLKPGATGWDIRDERVSEVTEGFAGSARLSDIDFFAMRRKGIDNVRERWDAVHRVVAGDTWTPFAEIRKKYPPQTEKYDPRIETAANDEWMGQPALQKIRNAGCVIDYVPGMFDLLLLTRDEYVRRCTKGSRVLDFHDVIRHGELLTNPDEGKVLAGLADDELLTCAVVKC